MNASLAFWTSIVTAIGGSALLLGSFLGYIYAQRPGILVGTFVGNANSASPEADRIRRFWYVTEAIGGGIGAAAGVWLLVRYQNYWTTYAPPVLTGIAAWWCCAIADLWANSLAQDRENGPGASLVEEMPAFSFDEARQSFHLIGAATVVWICTRGVVPADARGDHDILAGLTIAAGVMAIAHSAADTLRTSATASALAAQHAFWKECRVLYRNLAFAGVMSLLAVGVSTWMFDLGLRGSRSMLLALTITLYLTAMAAWHRLSRRYGQGGARAESAQDGELCGMCTSNRYWHLFGHIYFNRGDPRLWVERRIGMGVTPNFGRPMSFLILLLGSAWVALLLLVYATWWDRLT